MKKAFASIALICYLTVSSGIVINNHYCMNRLASTQLFATSKPVCDKCGMHIKKSNGCCHDEVKVVKLQQDQNTFSTASLTIPLLSITEAIPSIYFNSSFYNSDEVKYIADHSPPLISKQDTYLEIGVFRI